MLCPFVWMLSLPPFLPYTCCGCRYSQSPVVQSAVNSLCSLLYNKFTAIQLERMDFELYYLANTRSYRDRQTDGQTDTW